MQGRSLGARPHFSFSLFKLPLFYQSSYLYSFYSYFSSLYRRGQSRPLTVVSDRIVDRASSVDHCRRCRCRCCCCCHCRVVAVLCVVVSSLRLCLCLCRTASIITCGSLIAGSSFILIPFPLSVSPLLTRSCSAVGHPTSSVRLTCCLLPHIPTVRLRDACLASFHSPKTSPSYERLVIQVLTGILSVKRP